MPRGKRGGRLGLFDPSFGYGQLPSLTGFLLRKASVIDFGGFGDSVGDRAITPLRYSMLEVVGANPGLQQVQLAAILGLSKPAATLIIDFWQGRDCLERRLSLTDRRSYGVHLTSAGEQMLTLLRSRVTAHDQALTSGLSDQEVELLHQLLARIAGRSARPTGE